MILATTFSAAGGHPANEDAFSVIPHPLHPGGRAVFVADGQGGQAGGLEASNLACRVAAELVARADPSSLVDPGAWAMILEEADRLVAGDPDAGFASMVGFGVARGEIVGASAGDCAVLVVSRGEAEIVTGGQRKNPPVGSGAADFVPFATALEPPWTAMAMTDGAWKTAGWGRIVDAIADRSGRPLVEAIVGLARSPRTGELADDCTIILLEHLGPSAGGKPPG